jgi:hypothetical protein
MCFFVNKLSHADIDEAPKSSGHRIQGQQVFFAQQTLRGVRQAHELAQSMGQKLGQRAVLL